MSALAERAVAVTLGGSQQLGRYAAPAPAKRLGSGIPGRIDVTIAMMIGCPNGRAVSGQVAAWWGAISVKNGNLPA
jgi:hypothetical protein